MDFVYVLCGADRARPMLSEKDALRADLITGNVGAGLVISHPKGGNCSIGIRLEYNPFAILGVLVSKNRETDITLPRRHEAVGTNWSEQSVLVTGGTGSFGKKFVEIMLRDFQSKPTRDLQPRRAEAIRNEGFRFQPSEPPVFYR